MECEGSAFFYSHDEEAVSLFSLLERELRELSPILSLCLLQKKRKKRPNVAFFLSSSALLQLVRSEPQNNGKEGKFYRLLIFFTPNIISHARALTHTHALNNNHESSNHGIRENGRETRVFNVFLFFFDEVQNFLFLVDFDFVVVVVETIQETPFALQEV